MLIYIRIRILFLFSIIQTIQTTESKLVHACMFNTTCGCSSNDGATSRIIGGDPADADNWDWVVSLRVGRDHICGGTLISPSFVITAAHCLKLVNNLLNLKVYAGSRYLSVIDQERSVSYSYYPFEYDEEKFIHDIALLRLSSPFSMNDRSLAIICLPNISLQSYPPMNLRLVAIGWGTTTSDSRTPSNVLQQVTLSSVSRLEPHCRQILQNTDFQFCAGSNGEQKGSFAYLKS